MKVPTIARPEAWLLPIAMPAIAAPTQNTGSDLREERHADREEPDDDRPGERALAADPVLEEAEQRGAGGGGELEPDEAGRSSRVCERSNSATA